MEISFIVFLLVFVTIGLASFFRSQGTKEDYYLASHSVPPSLVGLSAVATNNSGYMFIGVIGYTYATGLASIWLMLGWIAGDFIASYFVHQRIRKAAAETGELSYPGVIAAWYGKKHHALQRLIAAISLVLLLAYASAQLVAGSKALQVLFGWPAWAGVVLGTVMVSLYCVAGGIRASIWTDAAQSLVMIFAMALLLVVGANAMGGVGQSIAAMGEVEGFLNWFPRDLFFPGLAGGMLFIAGWVVAGFSVIGQPHVMVRFMTLQHDHQMVRARAWYYLWFTLFYCMATGVGMLARIYIVDTGSFDAELALPTMAKELLHPVLVGLVLAGIFAATMSTADSLVLSCSAAITHDLLPKKIESNLLIKLATIIIALAAMLWALLNKESVFSLVILAWSGLGTAFSPLALALALGYKPSERFSIAIVIGGFLSVFFWRYFGWQAAVYEGLPGVLSVCIILYIVYALKNKNVSSSARPDISVIRDKKEV